MSLFRLFLIMYFTWNAGGGTLSGKNSCREKFCREKFCPNPYFAREKFCPVQLGVGKNINRREAPEIFEGIFPIIEVFV